MLADLGAQALGAITYGVYPTASASEVEYQLRDAGASVFVAQDQEYVDRILPFADRLPALRFIVVVDTSAMFSYAHPKLRGWDAVLGEPAPTTRRSPRWRRSPPRSIPAIPRSSSTPRARPAIRRARWWPTGATWRPPSTSCSTIPLLAEPQRTVVFLPLCHVLGTRRGADAAAALRAGAALRRGCRGPDADDLRGRADRALHGAALSTEVRLAGAGRRAERQPAQAARLRLGHARGPPPRARALGGPPRRRRARLRARARGRLPAAAQQARLRRARRSSSAAARRCRPRRWRCGRSGA